MTPLPPPPLHRFTAYNPLAAGLLTGKHTAPPESDSIAKGRFRENPNYLPRFYTERNFEALALIKAACDQEGLPLVEATFRWLLRHSALAPEDGIVLGASTLQQLEQNLEG